MKEALAKLEFLVKSDLDLQVMKTHDKTLCGAVHRWTTMLGVYMNAYNEIIQIAEENLQVRKTVFLNNIIENLVSRILELRRQLKKVENTNYQFLAPISDILITTCNTELSKLPPQNERPQVIQDVIDRLVTEVKEIKEIEENPVEEIMEEEEVPWWDETRSTKEEEKSEKIEEEEISEETKIIRKHLNLIVAHEKTRQVMKQMLSQKLRREKWEKELNGTAKPPASLEMREKSAKLIQLVFRKHFELKREKIKECKRNQILGLEFCQKQNIILKKTKNTEELNKIENYKIEIMKYEKEWVESYAAIKEKYLREKKDDMKIDLSGQIREWFIEWFNSIRFIHSIPRDGSATIFRSEISDPQDWIEEYEKHLEEKKANKGKNTAQFAKLAAKREAQFLKNKELRKNKMEAALLRKIKKNPEMHPGYYFPESKITTNLLENIRHYHSVWDTYDNEDSENEKEKYVKRLDLEDVLQEITLELLPEVDKEMRQEFIKLKRALKADYEANEEEMPEEFEKRKRKRKKKQKKIEVKLPDNFDENFKSLLLDGYVIQFPKTSLQDFIGDPNFAGDVLRCDVKPAFPYSYEVRSFWWEKCLDCRKGFRSILLVGPIGSGKTNLVHALATLNNAILFELDLFKVQIGGSVADILQHLMLKQMLAPLMQKIIACAKAVQPSVIHIKHVQMLFYKKVTPHHANLNLSLIKKFFIQRLFKQIHKNDKITIVGSCSDPWQSKMSILKTFTTVLLLPNTSYSLVVMILKKWLDKYLVIPRDLNISSLAYVLQGYSFGYIQNMLEKFTSADRIAKIAAYGLDPTEVYTFIINENQEKVDYDKYLQWYTTKTSVGQKETKHIKEQLEFQAAVENYNLIKKMRAEKKRNRNNLKKVAAIPSRESLDTIIEDENS